MQKLYRPFLAGLDRLRSNHEQRLDELHSFLGEYGRAACADALSMKEALDELRERFGDRSIRRGTQLTGGDN